MNKKEETKDSSCGILIESKVCNVNERFFFFFLDL